MVVAIVAAVPTLVAALLRPELLLDDIEFAARARFEGWSGFVTEMGYRPGQGLIHAVQFNLLGNQPVFHLVLLALGNAAAAWLFWRLLSMAVSRGVAVAASIAFVVLPNHGSLRFWTSTLPNHVAMCLLLLAAIVATPHIKRAHRNEAVGYSPGVWFAVAALSSLSIVTYEATISLAPFIVFAMAKAASTTRDSWVVPGLVLGVFGAAALVLKARSPRAASSSMFAQPFDAIPKHLGGIAPNPLAILGVAVVLGCVGWVLVCQVRSDRRVAHHARIGAVGVLLAFAGLAPFVAGGFNIQSHGVLDRAHYFPTLGTALLLGAAGHALYRSTESVVVRGALAAVVVIAVLGHVEDLGDYVRSSKDQREAATALRGLPAADAGDQVRISPPPASGGVAWGFYDQQLRDLYRLVHDRQAHPGWLAFGTPAGDDDPPPNMAYFDIADGQIVEPAGE